MAAAQQPAPTQEQEEGPRGGKQRRDHKEKWQLMKLILTIVEREGPMTLNELRILSAWNNEWGKLMAFVRERPGLFAIAMNPLPDLCVVSLRARSSSRAANTSMPVSPFERPKWADRMQQRSAAAATPSQAAFSAQALLPAVASAAERPLAPATTSQAAVSTQAILRPAAASAAERSSASATTSQAAVSSQALETSARGAEHSSPSATTSQAALSAQASLVQAAQRAAEPQRHLGHAEGPPFPPFGSSSLDDEMARSAAVLLMPPPPPLVRARSPHFGSQEPAEAAPPAKKGKNKMPSKKD